MNRKITAVIMIAIGAALAIAGFFLLPETVVVQINAQGQPSNTLPKLAAILIPLGLNILGAVVHISGDEKQSKKAVVISGAGYVLALLDIVINAALK